MHLLLLATLLGAPADEKRLFTELDVGVTSRPATAVAVAPGADRVILAGVEGLLFRSSDGGESWEVVLRTRAQTLLPVEEQIAVEDAAEEAVEAELPDDVEASDFAADLDSDEMEEAIDNLQADLEETLSADRETGADTSLPEGDLSVATDVSVPLVRELPGVRRIRFVTAQVVYVATDQGLFRSIDGGRDFERLALPRTEKARDVRDVAVSRDIPTTLFATTAAGTLRSLDGGLTWDPVTGPAGGAPGLSVAVGPGTTPLVVVGTRWGVARSVDGGNTFEVLALPGEGVGQPVISVAVDPSGSRFYAVTPRVLYAGGTQQGRVLTPVGGAWRDALLVVHTEPGRPSRLWAGGRRGLFASSDAGRTAVELGEEAMVRDVVDVAVGTQDPELVVVATAAGVFALKPVGRDLKGVPPMARFQALVEREPTASEVAEWAVDSHRVDPAVTVQMRKRSRMSALAPRLTLEANAGPLQPDVPYLYYYREQRTEYRVEAMAIWGVEKLIANPTEASVQREHRRLLAERERVYARVLKQYEARRRLQVDLMMRGSKGTLTHARKLLRLRELTARLDAETGGRFSKEAQRRGAPEDGIGQEAR
ncbi:MAG: hypothetical protein AB2A00_41700 [Myxococcota bacterium]